MNKLLTLGLVCVATGGVVWHQRSSLAVVRADARRLAAEAEAVAGSIERAQKDGARLEGELAEERAKAKGLRQDVAERDVQAEAAVELPGSLGPGQCWPANEPFCYLPKATLPRLGYMTFNMDGHVTDEAALLFGLSRTERARVEDAYAAFAQEVQAMDLAHLRPMETPQSHQYTFRKFRAQSYELEVPPEQPAALREGFEAAIHQVLAGDRGDLFLQANRRFLEEWFEELNEGSLCITLFTRNRTAPEQREQTMMVGHLHGEKQGNTKCWYPEDETAPGFQHFAPLLRQYEEQAAR